MIMMHGDAARRLPFNGPEEQSVYLVPGSDTILNTLACLRQVLAEDWDGTLPCGCTLEDGPQPPGAPAPPPEMGQQAA